MLLGPDRRRRVCAFIALGLCRWLADPLWAAAPHHAAGGHEWTILARQAALDRAGYSPGVIDGCAGRKTDVAVRAFQAARGLPPWGRFDEATLKALGVAGAPATVTYRVTAADIRDVGAVPRDWNAKAKLPRLRYESLAALLAERGHCTQATLRRLNRGRNVARLGAGETVMLPNVWHRPPRRAASLEVDLSEKVVRARDSGGHVMALFHCSVAKFASKRPHGTARVTGVAFDPVYRFDPAMWPEVRSVKRALRIPPGPRNPVGVCWIDLSLPGYGIHGTPTPELIGKTGSHGCVRLTNWDARRLGGMVRRGTPVKFVD